MASSGMLLAIAAVAFAIAFIGLMILRSVRTGSAESNRAAADPAALDWDVLLSAELQACLPHKKIEAIKQYREQTGVGLKEAKDAVEYAIAHPHAPGKTAAPLPAKAHETVLNWDVLLLPEIQDALPDHKIDAIKLYRQHTGVGLKEAMDAIGEYLENPGNVPAKIRRYDLVDEQAQGIRDLLRAGQRAEAQKVYQAFTGVDQFTASEALDALEHEIATEIERYDRLHEKNLRASDEM